MFSLCPTSKVFHCSLTLFDFNHSHQVFVFLDTKDWDGLLSLSVGTRSYFLEKDNRKPYNYS